ncbi:MAG: response regulator [Phycisphaerae bacterium]
MNEQEQRTPFSLVVTGEAEKWQPALELIIGRQYVKTHPVETQGELLDVVRAGQADAAVLDDQADLGLDVLQLLRMIRRLDNMLPVVVLTSRNDRRWLESALRLTAFSVEMKPLDLESLLRQIQRMMVRLDAMLRGDLDH